MPKSKKTSHLKMPDNPLGNSKCLKNIDTMYNVFFLLFSRQYITPQFIFGQICPSKWFTTPFRQVLYIFL